MVTSILSCLNEASALPQVLCGLSASCRVIVPNNGSTDGSADVANAERAKGVHVRERGLGAAVRSALGAATADVVCILDVGGSFDLCPDAVDGNRAHTRILVTDRRFGLSPRWTQLSPGAGGLDNREDRR